MSFLLPVDLDSLLFSKLKAAGVETSGHAAGHYLTELVTELTQEGQRGAPVFGVEHTSPWRYV